MRYESSFRYGRSLSPDLISKRYGYRSLSIPPTASDYELPSFTCMKDGSFSEHVDHLINRSRANSEVRSSDPYFREFPHLASSNDDLHYSSLLSNSLTPWSKTGAFYYPRDVGESLENFRQSIEAEITYNLEIEHGLKWEDGDVEISMEKEYEYPESWRGTAASIPALRREYFYWTNPARYYRHRTYYPRYYPRYRSRYYR
eukprot:GFUD01066996.1.p1 GENE.GFUD01066996.1~~GFUD01066996.1.p1  ORF type:complete len:201 (-),score=25.08 GFUD01066996.1:148-750(-)